MRSSLFPRIIRSLTTISRPSQPYSLITRFQIIQYTYHSGSSKLPPAEFNDWKTHTDQLNVADIGGEHHPLKHLTLHKPDLMQWERQADAFLCFVMIHGKSSTHEVRKTWETLPQSTYACISYYEEWIFGATQVAINRGLITEAQIQEELDIYFANEYNKEDIENASKIKFKPGDKVHIRNVGNPIIKSKNWRNFLEIPKLMHHRVPHYAQNRDGVILQYVDSFSDPKLEAFGIDMSSMPKVPLYRVEIQLQSSDSGDHDGEWIVLDVLQHWLEPIIDETNDHHHDHDHQHKHTHVSVEQIKQNAILKESTSSPYQILMEIVIHILVKNGVFTREALNDQIRLVEEQEHASFGVDLAIKCLKDEEFKNALLNTNDTMRLLAECGFNTGIAEPCTLRMVQNTENVHHLVVCTLCSCYPRNLMGIPPAWYKSKKYRAECISRPRELLHEEFGTVIPEDIKLVVNDSNNEVRYMVLPHKSQFKGFDHLSDDELKRIINRDHLIGVRR